MQGASSPLTDWINSDVKTANTVSIIMIIFAAWAGIEAISNVAGIAIPPETGMATNTDPDDTQRTNNGVIVGLGAVLGTLGLVIQSLIPKGEEEQEEERGPVFDEDLVKLTKWLCSRGTTTAQFFEWADTDNSGSIDMVEFANALRAAEIANLPPWEIEDLVKLMDINSDGRINLPELDIALLNIRNALRIEFIPYVEEEKAEDEIAEESDEEVEEEVAEAVDEVTDDSETEEVEAVEEAPESIDDSTGNDKESEESEEEAPESTGDSTGSDEESEESEEEASKDFESAEEENEEAIDEESTEEEAVEDAPKPSDDSTESAEESEATETEAELAEDSESAEDNSADDADEEPAEEETEVEEAGEEKSNESEVDEAVEETDDSQDGSEEEETTEEVVEETPKKKKKF